VVGVAGELWTQSRIGGVDTDIRNNSDILVALVSKHAGDAQTSADNSADAANRASVSASQAQHHADALESELAIEAKREEEAEHQLEAEKQKRLDLAASLLPRSVCEQRSLAMAVSRFPARKVIFEFGSDKEPRQLAEQMAWAFLNFQPPASHWSIRRRRVNEDAIADGIYIMRGWVPQPTLPPTLSAEDREIQKAEFERRSSTGMNLAKAVRDVLVKCSEEATAGEDTFAQLDIRNDGIRADELVIRIGSKPNRALESTIRELGPLPFSLPPDSSVAIGNLSMIPEEAPNEN
jgi:hypothetical protein